MDTADAFDEGLAAFGGGLTALAQALGEKVQAVSNWRTRGVPPNKCKAFESLTGVSVKKLRPNDWHEYWPEPAEPADKRQRDRRADPLDVTVRRLQIRRKSELVG